MAITLNPQLKMTSNIAFKQGEGAPAAATPVQSPAVSTVPTAVEKEAPKKHKVANAASNMAYAWINMTEGVKGVAKGVVAGALVGTGIAAADTVISGIGKKAYKQIFTAPAKAMGAVGKFVAPVVSLLVLGGYMIAAKLNANKKTANVDHQLYTNHRAKTEK